MSDILTPDEIDRAALRQGEEHDAPCMYSDDPPPVRSAVPETLSPNEMAHAQHESSYAASAPQRWEGQEIWQGRENEEMRMVNAMHCEVFIKKLQDFGIKIYLNNFVIRGRIGLHTKEYGIQNGIIGIYEKIQTTLQFPWSYEYTVMRFNQYNVPTNEKYRGWRTTILHLIANKVITEEQAHAIFGKPTGLAAMQYLKELWALRHVD